MLRGIGVWDAVRRHPTAGDASASASHFIRGAIGCRVAADEGARLLGSPGGQVWGHQYFEVRVNAPWRRRQKSEKKLKMDGKRDFIAYMATRLKCMDGMHLPPK